MSPTRLAVLAGLGVALGAGRARAEAMFLNRQYTSCTACHYSPTGGGLLTPYGRSLSREELSTTGRMPSAEAEPTEAGEQSFLWGALGNRLGHLDLGFDTRPAHLSVGVGGFSSRQDMLMNADLLAAYRANGWTVYGEVGREPLPQGSKIDSYEHWVGYEGGHGLGLRVGRFLPAYGVRLADHTAFTRSSLGFDVFDQLYALELSRTGARHLVQLSVSPGRADSILHDDGRRAFTAAGRVQLDLGARSALVVSGLYRAGSRAEARNGAGGVAWGLSPTRRLSLWTEADAQVRRGAPGVAYTLLNEASLEVFRGVWLKFSPQLRTDFEPGGGSVRLAFEADLLPRTHWNADVSYYRDRSRVNDLVTRIVLAQLHLYL